MSVLGKHYALQSGRPLVSRRPLPPHRRLLARRYQLRLSAWPLQNLSRTRWHPAMLSLNVSITGSKVVPPHRSLKACFPVTRRQGSNGPLRSRLSTLRRREATKTGGLPRQFANDGRDRRWALIIRPTASQRDPKPPFCDL